MTETQSVRRMLTLEQVLEMVPVSRATLYRLIDQGRFPKPHYVTPNKRFWYDDEIVAWQKSLPADRQESLAARLT
jgi:prophage regulatory protein